MLFGMCNASATFQRGIVRALQKIVNREGSIVMAYIDDIFIATEMIEDHMERLPEVFQCLREAGFKMRVTFGSMPSADTMPPIYLISDFMKSHLETVSKCDFMKSEIKCIGRIVSAEGIEPDPKAVSKLHDWNIPPPKPNCKVSLDLGTNIVISIPARKFDCPLTGDHWYWHAIYVGGGATTSF